MARSDSLQPVLHGDPLKLGYDFKRPGLLAEALVHRSALDRQPDLKAAHPHGNERLEFLGDRVLALAMADLLLKRFPGEAEGDMARRLAALVQESTLAEIAREIGLGPDIVLGESERHSGDVRPAILADALEAVLGAIFLDAGFEAAAGRVRTLWGDRLDSHATSRRDPKTALQEWAQGRKLALPSYREVGREGPAHAPLFVIEVSVKGHEAVQGRGASKREAESAAARVLLERVTSK